MNKQYARYLHDEAFRAGVHQNASRERAKALEQFIFAPLKAFFMSPRVRRSRMLRRHTAFG